MTENNTEQHNIHHHFSPEGGFKKRLSGVLTIGFGPNPLSPPNTFFKRMIIYCDSSVKVPPPHFETLPIALLCFREASAALFSVFPFNDRQDVFEALVAS